MRANNDCLLCLRNEPGMAQTGLVHFVVSVQLRTSAGTETTTSNVLEGCVSSIVIIQHQLLPKNSYTTATGQLFTAFTKKPG